MTTLTLFCGCAVNETYVSSEATPDGPIVMRTASAQDDDPFEAGRQAALALQEQMGDTAPHTVVLTECFEGWAQKEKVLKGVCSVFAKEIVFGFVIILFLIFEPDGLAARWRTMRAYWKLWPFSY